MNTDIVQWAMTAVLALGLIGSFIRNGRSSNEKFTEVKTIVEGIKEDLDSEDNGLNAINNKIGSINTNCARVSSSLTERVAAHDREIRDLKAKQ